MDPLQDQRDNNKTKHHMAKIDSGRGGGETRDRRDGIDEAEN